MRQVTGDVATTHSFAASELCSPAQVRLWHGGEHYTLLSVLHFSFSDIVTLLQNKRVIVLKSILLLTLWKHVIYCNIVPSLHLVNICYKVSLFAWYIDIWNLFEIHLYYDKLWSDKNKCLKVNARLVFIYACNYDSQKY